MQQLSEKVYTFSIVGQFLLLSEEDFKRMLPELINWHREVKKMGFKDYELHNLKLKWIDDGKVNDVIFEDKISDVVTERTWLTRESEK